MLYIYDTTSLTDSDIANAYSNWVGQDVAKLGNSSFGECEYQAWLDGSMKIDDNLFMQAAAQGQTMFASTGDTGSSCALAPTNGVPASGPPMVSYPAASPWVIGVGGTSVVSGSPSATYVGEAAWNSGGGGISQFENSTSWQQQTLPTSTGLAATNLRGLPDIAMAADADTGAYIVYGQNIPGVGRLHHGLRGRRNQRSVAARDGLVRAPDVGARQRARLRRAAAVPQLSRTGEQRDGGVRPAADRGARRLPRHHHRRQRRVHGAPRLRLYDGSRYVRHLGDERPDRIVTIAARVRPEPTADARPRDPLLRASAASAW